MANGEGATKLRGVIQTRLQPTAATVVAWRSSAACSGLPHSVFFPVAEADEDEIALAKEICLICPVTEDCLEFALETNQRSGIWGGTAEEDRKALRRKWLAARRRMS
ncbi:MAG: WhiB family transcriptional regulator [Actinomycetota bacterium]|nr:WhiB family transcriptional regulator [Actinomycetota bacterium]